MQIKEGREAPRYNLEDVKKLTMIKAVITEQGTSEGLPVVDIVMIDESGKEYFFMTTGRIINGISSAIKGVNTRIHGTEEP